MSPKRYGDFTLPAADALKEATVKTRKIGLPNYGVSCTGLAALLLAAITVFATPAAAQDYAFKPKEAGDILVRLRGVWVHPIVKADINIGGDVDVGNDFVPEIDFSYFITDEIALELIAATTRHEVTYKPGNLDLGKVSLLPPTLTVQYHPLPKARFSPYVGAGLNYTFFFDVDSGAFRSVDYSNSLGYALQGGLDWAIQDNWSANFDVKKLWLSTDVKISGGIRADVDLNPWLIGFGLGYRF